MKNPYFPAGKPVTVPANGTSYLSGQAYVAGLLVGVCIDDATDDDLVSVKFGKDIQGMEKASADVFAQGVEVDVTDQGDVVAEAGGTKAGIVALPAANGDAYAMVAMY